MTSSELRQKYLDYFKAQGHAVRPSASLVPADPTVLFTVAGMVQFKPYFLGTVPKPFTRAATSQKCVRTNDIENVGFTPRHHTFFEMLGNFSFGDYFKAEAIQWAWDFLVNVIGLEKEKLWITVHREDDEALAIWKNQVGVPEKRIVRMGEKTNFWTMGETGPCGPCSEILYDTGPKPGKPEAGPDQDEDRYLEVWNLVFTQYDRQADGKLLPLPQKNIDTGMGLERLAAVHQGVSSNFDTDLFQPLIQAVAKETMSRYGKDAKTDSSLRVIADHVRCAAFLIADGVLPGNEGRGYVLRRIVRRAVRHGKLLGLNERFLHRLVPGVAQLMGGAYPELLDRAAHAEAVVRSEEERFQHTLDSGLAILNDIIAEMKAQKKTVIPGKRIFQLYDTYGFPLDLTREIAQEHKLGLDEAGFQQAMEEQRDRARSAWVGSGERALSPAIQQLEAQAGPTRFVGYQQLKAEATVLAVLSGDQRVESAAAGSEVAVVLDTTPFYAASGGQVADQGELTAGGLSVEITDVQKSPAGVALHLGRVVQGQLEVRRTLTASVRNAERAATARNHTATHLLHAALRQVLGKHVEQAGSEVRPDGFRFDFSHFQAVNPRELDRIEDIVNAHIRENAPVMVEELSIEAAKARGAMALFGEKYGDWVRMVSVDQISCELCGGTHVRATGEIGMLRIVSEASVAAGVRRIEAVTGEGAYRETKREQRLLRDAADSLRVQVSELPARVEKLAARVRELEKEREKLQVKQAGKDVDELLKKRKKIGDYYYIAAELPGLDAGALRTAADALKQKMDDGFVVLGSILNDKTFIAATATASVVNSGFNNGEFLKALVSPFGGSAGGRPDFGQGGLKDSSKLASVLEEHYINEVFKKFNPKMSS